MINAQDLWKKRLGSHYKELNRYLRLMFNDHFSIALFFFLAGLSYVYQQWLQDLPDGFPTAVVLAVLFGLLLTYSPIRTMLKEPDLVFLLPAEFQLSPFFRNGIIYSYITQMFPFLFVFVAAGPLYFTSFEERSISQYIVIGAVIVVLKAWNVLAHWWEVNSRDGVSGWIDAGVRFLLNGLTIYFVVIGEAWLYAAVTTVLLFGMMMYDYSLAKKRRGVAWDLLIVKEQARMQAFYRVANLFTDVPHLKQSIKKRHWLVRLLKQPVPFQQDKTFDYLYRITFIRSSDYLGLYLRLLVIAFALIYFLPNLWMQLGFSFLFLYMSGFQMVTIWHHHRQLDWLELYPVPFTYRKQALLKWLFQLMLCKTFVLGIAFLISGNFIGLALVWLGGGLFSYWMVYSYFVKRMTV